MNLLLNELEVAIDLFAEVSRNRTLNDAEAWLFMKMCRDHAAATKAIRERMESKNATDI